jgi:hypothetical protein
MDDVCVTRDQFAEVFGSSRSAAAAGAPSSGVPLEAPAASPVPEGTDADAGTTASNVAEPQPTVAPQDDSTATTESAEADPEQDLAPANDNDAAEQPAATGTDD